MKRKIGLVILVLFAIIMVVGLLNKPITLDSSNVYLSPEKSSNFCEDDCLTSGTSHSYDINIPTAGQYDLVVSYTSSDEMLSDDIIDITYNDEVEEVTLPKKFAYDTEEASLDRYGNEIIGTQDIMQTESSININDYQSIESLNLKEGKFSLDIEAVTNDIEINNVEFVNEDESLSTTGDASGANQIIVEAEDFSYKSDSAISSGYAAQNDVTPVSTTKQVNNIIKGDTFDEDKQSLTYVFNAPKSGMYKFGINGRNELPEGKSVYLNIYVNGKLAPEYTNVEVSTSSDFELTSFDTLVYLEEGENEVTIELRLEAFEDQLSEIDALIDEITEIDVELQKVTGGIEDDNRSWKISSYIPDINDRLVEIQTQVDTLRSELGEEFTSENELTNSLDLIMNNMDTITKNSDDLPNYSTLFSDGTASVKGMLVQLQTDLQKSNYSIDKLMFVPESSEFEIYQPNFANNLVFSVEKLIGSFTNNEEIDNLEYDQEIDVWVKRPRQYVDVMQKMVDEEFTPETGIKVNFSIITDQNKLTMSNAARLTPDAAMSLDTWYIYQLALRGGLYDFTESTDNIADVLTEYAPGGLNQLIVDNGLYGLPETQDIYTLYYRSDIFEENGFEVPETWSDVLYLLPQLQTKGMDFYIPTSSSSSLKTLPSTGFFFLQNNADLFSEDGLSVNLTDEKQQESLQFMVDLYNRYGIEKQVPNFYDSFRDGSVPIGISNFSTYVQLSYAAPEIAGDWSVALVPGVQHGDEITRWMPGGVGAQGSVIFEQSENKDAAVEFLSWWNSSNVQSKYIQYLISSYGAEYMWNSSNLDAFETLPIAEEDMDIFQEQAEWVYDMPLTPANYYVERGISDIWNAAVFDGESVRVESEYQQTISNQELEKRYQEFGYIDEDGNIIKKYPIPSIDQTEGWIEENV